MLLLSLGVGITVYQAKAYSLRYTMCFNHDFAMDNLKRPKVSTVYVSPVLINANNFIISAELVEQSLTFGNSSSVEVPPVNKIQVRANTGVKADNSSAPIAAYPDMVDFTPPREPGPLLGRARYIYRYGKDPKAPFEKTLVIKGAILGAVSPDGRGGAFRFVPDLDSDTNYTGERCRMAKEGVYYVQNP